MKRPTDTTAPKARRRLFRSPQKTPRRPPPKILPKSLLHKSLKLSGIASPRRFQCDENGPLPSLFKAVIAPLAHQEIKRWEDRQEIPQANLLKAKLVSMYSEKGMFNEAIDVSKGVDIDLLPPIEQIK